MAVIRANGNRLKPARAQRPFLLLLGILSGTGALTLSCAALAQLIMMRGTPKLLAAAAVFLGTIAYPLCSRGIGAKRLVLLLRRFGDQELNAAVLNAFRDAMGRRYRVVTLDDSSFVPVGIPGRIVLTSVASALAIGFLLGTGSSVAILPFVIDSQDPDHIVWEAEIAIVLVLLLAIFIAVVGALLYVAAFLYQRKERLTEVTEPHALRSVLHSVRDAKRVQRSLAFAAPLARVVRVTDALWKEAVIAIGGAADVAIIDVSIPSESIAWELRQMADLGVPCLVLQRAEGPSEAEVDSTWRNDIDRLARDRPQLSYGNPESLSWEALLKGISQTGRPATSTVDP